jgi:hypothetical protein
MASKQFSVSVINLATSIGSNRRNSAIAIKTDTTLDQRKHALSEENLPTIVRIFVEI